MSQNESILFVALCQAPLTPNQMLSNDSCKNTAKTKGRKNMKQKAGLAKMGILALAMNVLETWNGEDAMSR